MSKVYGVLGMPPGDLAAKQNIKAAGCTHTTVVAYWSSLQPNGPNTALASSAVTALNLEFTQAASAGLKVMFEIVLQYPPGWVLSNVEAFTDQNGNVWSDSTSGSGKQVVNWMWTSLGRSYVTDFVNRVAAGLGNTNIAAIDAVKTGGGFYGETHYPPPAASGNSFYGFGNSMQTGTGLAGDEVVCPLPGYVPFGTGSSDVNDSIWCNWYLNGLLTWVEAFIAIQRAAGFSADFHVCVPGYGIRANNLRSSSAYQSSAAFGEDPCRLIAALAHDPQVWPYSTWLNTVDGYPGGTTDSDKAAWKKIAEEAQKRNKHFRLWGENTGNETTAQMQAIFSGYQYGSALAGASYPGAPVLAPRYNGLFWLSYSSLTSGSSGIASMADLAAAISAAG